MQRDQVDIVVIQTALAGAAHDHEVFAVDPQPSDRTGGTGAQAGGRLRPQRTTSAIQFAYGEPGSLPRTGPGRDLVLRPLRCPIVYRNSEESQLVGAFTADGGGSWTAGIKNSYPQTS